MKEEKNNKKPVVKEEKKSAKVKKEEKKEIKEVKRDDSKKKVVKEVVAITNHLRIAPRKVRLVAEQLKNRPAVEALYYLRFVNKISAGPIGKLINSALANAEHNFNLDKNDLYIKSFIVNDGPALKRWRPRAYGRAARILKKTSHLELTLGVFDGAKVKVKEVDDKNKKKEEVKVVNPDEVKKDFSKGTSYQAGGKTRKQKGHLKQIFNRKTG